MLASRRRESPSVSEVEEMKKVYFAEFFTKSGDMLVYSMDPEAEEMKMVYSVFKPVDALVYCMDPEAEKIKMVYFVFKSVDTLVYCMDLEAAEMKIVFFVFKSVNAVFTVPPQRAASRALAPLLAPSSRRLLM